MTAAKTPAPMVSIVVPCRNEEHYIAECLDSILACDYPRERLEVLVVDGMSDDGTRRVLAEYAVKHPLIHVLDNPRRITPVALNTAIRAARGDVIVRMDAHVVYPKNYVSRLVAALD
ncbi:MAG TPA: glycosyltransferase, partial [Gemmatimonadales bacterium]|nr:glycosyltransferase [Gemmatimonadales bacterium]